MPTGLAALKYIAEHAGSGVLPVLDFLHVYGGRMQVGNGRYWVDTPSDLPDATVHAGKLAAAWAACKTDAVEVGRTDLNLTLKAGRIRARIALADQGSYPRCSPDPKAAETDPGVARLLGFLHPYIATDHSRPWATSVCLNGAFAYVTNNVLLLRSPFPAILPTACNIPAAVIPAIVDKGEPTGIGWSETSVTFYFDDDTWIKTLLIQGDWPTATVDKFVGMLEGKEWATPHADLSVMLATAEKVSSDRFVVAEFDGVGFKLRDGTFDADDLAPVPATGRVNAAMAALAMKHADGVQWHGAQQDVHGFRMGDILGVFAGVR